MQFNISIRKIETKISTELIIARLDQMCKNELKFMTISQPGIKSNIFYCHTGLVLMNGIATQDYIHDPTSRSYILDNMTSFANKRQIFLWQIVTVTPIKGTRTSVDMPGFQTKSLTITIVCGNDF